MDFSKFTSSIPSSPSGGYIIEGIQWAFQRYELFDQDGGCRSNHEVEKQISALRQSNLLHPVNKKNILKSCKPSFSQKQPDLILLRFTFENTLIGYGGLVHIN